MAVVGRQRRNALREVDGQLRRRSREQANVVPRPVFAATTAILRWMGLFRDKEFAYPAHGLHDLRPGICAGDALRLGQGDGEIGLMVAGQGLGTIRHRADPNGLGHGRRGE